VVTSRASKPAITEIDVWSIRITAEVLTVAAYLGIMVSVAVPISDAPELGTKWTAAYRERGLTYMLTGEPQPAIVDLATYDQLQLGDLEADYL
jgi:hypothetical protein